MNIKQLREEYKQRAQDLGLRVQVLMDGDINAEIAIVGEGPGQQDINAEAPFMGTANQLLWNSLRTHGILRTSSYHTHVCKRQISLAANTKYPVATDEWAKWQLMLHWELEQLPNLRYILCVGEAGLNVLFGEQGIAKFRGSVYEWHGKQVTIAFNPLYVSKDPKQEIVFLMDIKRFATTVKGDYKPFEINKIINPSYKEARQFIEEMTRSTAPVSWDIETISGETACHGLANQAHEAMCINLRDSYQNRYSPEEELQLLYDLQNLFATQRIIAQNGNFDAHWCGYKDYLDAPIWFDTMLAHHTLYPLLPHNLGFLTTQYTTHPFYKDDGKNFKEGGDIEGFWRYNATDAAVTWECARILQDELKSQGLSDFFFNHVMRLNHHLVRSTCDGVLVDLNVKAEIAHDLHQDVAKINQRFLEQVREVVGSDTYTPNINSNPQMRELFLSKLNLKSATGTVDATAREKMKEDVRTSPEALAILHTYDEYQRERKFLSTYAEMRVDNDDRFRTTWKQQGVTKAPGRLSSSGNLWGTASNIQNQPGRAHKFFVSDPGTVFFYADGSQAEARVVAYLADIQKWKEDFERARLTGDYDAHRALAADMYKIPYNDIPKEDWVVDPNTGLEVPTIRYKAKRARHGLNYRMNWPRLAEAAKLNMYEAKKTYILYHAINPEIKEWWAETERIVKKTKQLFTPLGRRLRIMQRLDDGALDSIIAFVPQSTIGDMVKRIWYMCHEDPEWDDRYMRIKINVHDAVIGMATPDKVQTALRILKKHAEKPIMIQDVYKKKTEPLIIPADFKVSEPDEFGLHRWSTLKKAKFEF